MPKPPVLRPSVPQDRGLLHYESGRQTLTTPPTTSWSGNRNSFPTPMRQAILARDPICRACGQRPATEADHIINHAECTRRGINPDTLDNGQGLCRGCHWTKTKREQRQGKARLATPRRVARHPSEA